MSMFKKLSTEGLESQKDSLGGGFIRESGLYEATVKLAYAHEATSGAMGVTVFYELADGSELRDTQYVTSGRDKGGNNYYVKDGKQIPLPGFTIINDLCILTSEKPLSEQDTRERTVSLYDFEAKREVPTSVQCIDAIEGEKVWIGLQKVVDNKTQKNDATGKYEKINEKRELNEINKLFHFDTKVTVVEAMNGADSTFFDSWDKKYTGVDRVKYEEQAESGRQGAPRRQTAAPTQSSEAPKKSGLFGKK